MTRVRKAFPMQSSHTFSTESAVFDERNLVSAGGLVPVLELAEQTGLSRLIGEHVELPSTRVRSGAVNPAGKLTTIIAGMMCGADSIDDANLLRAGGTPRVFDEVYAPSTVGILLREFSFGHANQLAAVARAHLIALAARTPLLAGTDERMFLDIDSLLRPVYGHHKQGASFGHAKIAGRALLRKGLSPLITTLSVPTAAPVIAEAWLRSGKTGSGRGAARQLKQAATTARAIDPDATIMARGDSAFGTKKVIAALLDEQIEFSLTLSRNRRVTTAIQAIDDAAFTPVHYQGAVEDPDTGALISDAEVAETTHTLNYLVRRRGMLTSPPGESYGFVRSDAELPLPDLELFFGPAPFFDEGLAHEWARGAARGDIAQAAEPSGFGFAPPIPRPSRPSTRGTSPTVGERTERGDHGGPSDVRANRCCACPEGCARFDGAAAPCDGCD